VSNHMGVQVPPSAPSRIQAANKPLWLFAFTTSHRSTSPMVLPITKALEKCYAIDPIETTDHNISGRRLLP